MADKHPYVLSTLHIIQLVEQLRRSFPSGMVVNSEFLKKLGLAPNNEGYVINTFRFLGIIDTDGKKTDRAAVVFSKHDNQEFAQEFSKLVEEAYIGLFEMYREQAWELDQGKLISFFRGSDQTGEDVGRRQARTFQTLASVSGKHAPLPVKERGPSSPRPSNKADSSKAKELPPRQGASHKMYHTSEKIPTSKTAKDFGLTVRIEINLPAGAEKDTYDNIFRSIREYLIDVK